MGNYINNRLQLFPIAKFSIETIDRMKTRKTKTIVIQISLAVILLLLVIGCGSSAQEIITANPRVLPTKNPSGLSGEASATLSSLEKLDEYPFYVMHFKGAYSYPNIRAYLANPGGFGCSLFASLGMQGDNLYGRNFDWEYSPAMLLFTDPPDGYASASMVDLTFVGIDVEKSKLLLDNPLENRIGLLDAPSMPFDGMNEYGLVIGMAALPDQYIDDASYDSSRMTIGSIGIIRQVLDHAKNVDEAVEIFKQYNIDFSGGPPIHYLLADRNGKASLIEFSQGEMVVLPNENTWHLATNHLRYTSADDGGCWRYRTLRENLTAQNGVLDTSSAMQLLSQVKQDITQWSVVYDMTSGDIHVVLAGDYDNSYRFHLDLSQP